MLDSQMQFRDNLGLFDSEDPKLKEAYKHATLNLELLRKRSEVPSWQKSKIELVNDLIYGLDMAYAINLKNELFDEEDPAILLETHGI